jgi:hypothetical protein
MPAESNIDDASLNIEPASPPARRAAEAALVVLLATSFDLAWKLVIPAEHSAAFGMLHGALLFGACGAWLSTGRLPVRLKAAGGGLLAGLAAAGSFYLVWMPLFVASLSRPWVYKSSLLASWLCVFVALATLCRALARPSNRRSAPATLARGLCAALTSAPGFALVFWCWRQPAGGAVLLLTAAAWLTAFAPAAACLNWRSGGTSPAP